MPTILYKNELLHIEEEHLNHFNKYSWQIHIDSKSSTKYLYRCINGTTRKFHREILNCPAEGRFKTKEEAILARKEAERQYNFHDLHGSIKI